MSEKHVKISTPGSALQRLIREISAPRSRPDGGPVTEASLDSLFKALDRYEEAEATGREEIPSSVFMADVHLRLRADMRGTDPSLFSGLVEATGRVVWSAQSIEKLVDREFGPTSEARVELSVQLPSEYAARYYEIVDK